ncbi:hypothetical protein GQ55_1G119500 [Panicum hallii var. hallii]|uniref:Uncharacterized protein n=1 Tax=Panicum hallii var. hallii TaxID=1504633 RepID=A0A2T7F4R2_9POAL|nr:hypothetical protein GQ55_1G119500 [Panicum hallii var. hallii]
MRGGQSSGRAHRRAEDGQGAPAGRGQAELDSRGAGGRGGRSWAGRTGARMAARARLAWHRQAGACRSSARTAPAERTTRARAWRTGARRGAGARFARCGSGAWVNERRARARG